MGWKMGALESKRHHFGIEKDLFFDRKGVDFSAAKMTQVFVIKTLE
jgi:hypothetical protein